MPQEDKTTEQRVFDLENDFANLMLKQGELKYPLDKNSVDILRRFLEEYSKEFVFDIVWRDFTYITSLMDSIERYDTTVPAGGSVSVTDQGLVLETGTTAAAQFTANLIARNDRLMQFDKETRFRVILSIDDVDNADLEVTSLEDTSGGYIGFKVDGGVITGISSDGTSTSSVSLDKTVIDGEEVELEFRYDPLAKACVFMVNGDERGTIKTNFPQDASGDKYIFSGLMITDDTTQRTAFIRMFEYIQKK